MLSLSLHRLMVYTIRGLRVSVKLSACLNRLMRMDLPRCLSILFWISACKYASSRDFAFVGAVEISSLRVYDCETILLLGLYCRKLTFTQTALAWASAGTFGEEQMFSTEGSFQLLA